MSICSQKLDLNRFYFFADFSFIFFYLLYNIFNKYSFKFLFKF